MKKIAIVFTLCSLISTGIFGLTIDTNELMSISSVTNIILMKIDEPEIPNAYLRTGDMSKIQFEPPETPLRRFDIVFFVSIPITYYLTLNIMQIVNREFGGCDMLSQVDMNYIYFNTLLIPLFVAYEDYIFVENRKKIDAQFASKPDLRFGFTVFRTRF